MAVQMTPAQQATYDEMGRLADAAQAERVAARAAWALGDRAAFEAHESLRDELLAEKVRVGHAGIVHGPPRRL